MTGTEQAAWAGFGLAATLNVAAAAYLVGGIGAKLRSVAEDVAELKRLHMYSAGIGAAPGSPGRPGLPGMPTHRRTPSPGSPSNLR